MKKGLKLGLLLTVVAIISGCTDGTSTTSSGSPTTSSGSPTTSSGSPTTSSGSPTTSSGSPTTSSETPISSEPLPSTGKYTLNDYVAGSPKTWNVHQWETSDDSIIMSYIEMGLYDFVLNEEKEGYEIIPEMAAEFPIDVTSEISDDEKEQYNVPSGEANLVYDIKLNTKARWEDGTPIDAETYVQSMKYFLDPQLINYRANSWFSGELRITNAAKYYKSNRASYEPYKTYKSQSSDGKKYFNLFLENTFAALNNDSIYNIYNKYKENTEMGGFPLLTAMFNDTGTWGTPSKQNNVEVTTTNSAAIKAAVREMIEKIAESGEITLTRGYFNVETNWENFWFAKVQFPEFSFDHVGIRAVSEEDDYTIRLYLEAPIKGFNMYYNLAGNWIVHEETYRSNMHYYDENNKNGLKYTTYGTNLQTTKAYGPYRLDAYQVDKNFHLTRNENWYGWTDGEHVNKYKATDINYNVIPKHATALEEFLKGNLDIIDLSSDDMERFRGHERLLRTPNSYTTKITLNTSFSKLTERQKGLTHEGSSVNKTILTNLNFRQAFSFALNRQQFANTLTAGSSGFVAPLNTAYISDPETGEVYRYTEQAKKVVSNVFGENTFGYDSAYATSLFKTAIEEENNKVAEGTYKKGNVVMLDFLVYNTDEIYSKMASFIKGCLDAATVGTALEGKIVLNLVPNANYYDKIRTGDADMIFSTWGGADMNPFVLTTAYCDPSQLFEYGFSPKLEDLTLRIDPDGRGERDITMNYFQWSTELNDGEYSSAAASHSVRLDILAGIEEALIKQFRFMSIYERASVSIRSYKINYGVDKYITVVGYGGLRDLEFVMNDASWANYIKSSEFKY